MCPTISQPKKIEEVVVVDSQDPDPKECQGDITAQDVQNQAAPLRKRPAEENLEEPVGHLPKSAKGSGIQEPLQAEEIPKSPVLPGCLDKNFKCPVVIMEQHVQAITECGFSKEVAEEALVKHRGSLPQALGSLVRSRYGPPPPSNLGGPNASQPPASPKASSPSPSDLVGDVAAVSRREQQKLRDDMKGENDDEEDEGEGNEDEEEKPKTTRKRPAAKAKPKAKAKGKARAKAKAKSKSTKGKKTTNKSEDDAKKPGNKAKEPASDKAKVSKRGRKAKEVDTDNGEKATFARRYIPKSEPLRSLWQAARKVWEDIKGEMKCPSKQEDKSPSHYFRKSFKNVFNLRFIKDKHGVKQLTVIVFDLPFQPVRTHSSASASNVLVILMWQTSQRFKPKWLTGQSCLWKVSWLKIIPISLAMFILWNFEPSLSPVLIIQGKEEWSSWLKVAATANQWPGVFGRADSSVGRRSCEPVWLRTG